MNIDEPRMDAVEIIKTLGSKLEETRRIVDCDEFADQARKRLENVRKKFQRTIDERLLCRPGSRRFAIHEREALQELLNKLVAKALAQIEVLVSACRSQIAEPSTRL